MKNIITLILLVVSACFVQAQEINWMSMNEALEAQEKEPRKIIMDAYTTWCGPCKMLDKNTFSNKDVIEYINENYYAVKFNAEGEEKIHYKENEFTNPGFDPEKKGRNSTHQFALAMRVSGYPTLVFFDEEAQLIAPVTGYRTPQQLELYLKLFATDDYKNLNSKEAFTEYERNFEGSF